MPLISLGEWLPDASDYGNPGTAEICNAVPGPNSWKSHPSLASDSDALGAYPRGAIEAVDADGNTFQYAGDIDTLYELDSASWSDVSKSGGYSTGTGERWEFVRWKEKVIATNFSDSPQQITFSGANFSDLTTALRFRHVAVVRDFVVAGNTYDAVDGNVRDRVRWSAQGDETDWTVSATTLSDYRDLSVGGGVQRIFGGDYGVVLMDRTTFRMTWAGAPVVFQIEETIPGIGLLAPGAAAMLAGVIYILSEHGFFAIRGGSQAVPIGNGRVDRYFRSSLNESYLDRMSCVADPRSGRIYWAYPSTDSVDGTPDRVIVYDTGLDRWGQLEVDIELIWRAGGVGVTLDGLDSYSSDLDALGASLDSAQWKGGSPLLSAFNTSYEKANFSGSDLTAVLATRETNIHPGHLTLLSGFMPMVDGLSPTVTARVGTRDQLTEAVTYGSSLSQNSEGKMTCLSNARYHRIELTVSGDWEDAIGVFIDPYDARKGGRRG